MQFLKNFLLVMICVSAIACADTHDTISKSTFSVIDSVFLAEGFDSTVAFREPSCLYYKNKPLFTIGQNIKQFDSSFSFRYDPEGKYKRNMPAIKDYLSVDDFYSAQLSTGLIGGILYFSADSSGTIFRFTGNWLIDGDLVDTSGMEILHYLHDRYFPCLPPDIKSKHAFELEHKNFIEKFKLNYLPEDTSGRKDDFTGHWSLRYSIELKKKKNGM